MEPNPPPPPNKKTNKFTKIFKKNLKTFRFCDLARERRI